MDGLDFGNLDFTSSLPQNFADDLNIGNFAAGSGFGGFNPNFMAGGLNFGPSPMTNLDLGSSAVNLPGVGGWGIGEGPMPTSGGGGGGLQDVSNLARQVAPILGVGTSLAHIPLSLAALSQAGRGTKALESAVATESRAAAPGIAASEKLLPAGTEALLTGVLPPELQASVDNQVNQARQALLQQLVSQGIDPQTAQAMIETQMQELKTNLTMQAAQALLSGGGATGTQAIEAAALGGKLAGGETGTATTALSEAQRALLRLTGSSA